MFSSWLHPKLISQHISAVIGFTEDMLQTVLLNHIKIEERDLLEEELDRS